MLSQGLRVARYYFENEDALCNSRTNMQGIRHEKTAQGNDPGSPSTKIRAATKGCFSAAPRLNRVKSERAHWGSGSTIQIGLSLSTVADQASVITYPQLPKQPKLSATNKGAHSEDDRFHSLADGLQWMNIQRPQNNKLSPPHGEELADNDSGRPAAQDTSDSSDGPRITLVSPQSSPRVLPRKAAACRLQVPSIEVTELSDYCNTRLEFMKSCNSCFGDDDQWLKLTGASSNKDCYSPGNLQDSRMDLIYQIPCAVAYMSGTIKHIHRASKSFRENAEGLVRFPTLSNAVMLEVVGYLYWLWWKSTKAPLTGVNTGKKKQTVRNIPAFHPQTTLLFELMDAAVYLDLPDLVETCADNAAAHFDSITSFGDLPRPLVRNVLKKLSMGDLCMSEYDLVFSEFSCISHDQESPERVYLETGAIWVRNYIRVESHISADEYPNPPPNPRGALFYERPTLLRKRARHLCIRFYVEQCLRRELPEPAEHKLFRILQMEGEGIEQLELKLTSQTTAHVIEVWIIALQKLINVREIVIIIESSVSTVFDLLRQKQLFAGKIVRLVLVCSDSIKMEDLAIAVTAKAAITQTSQVCIPELAKGGVISERGWQPAFPQACTTAIEHTPSVKPINTLQQNGIKAARVEIVSSPRGVAWRMIAPVLFKFPLPSPLTELCLSGHNLGPCAAAALASALETQQTSLQTLRLARCRLGSAGIGKLALALRKNTTLRRLDLSWNTEPDDNQTHEAARVLAQLLAVQSSSIHDVTLSGNHFTTVGMAAIIDAMKRNPRITSIAVSHMDLNASLTSLGKALAETQRRVETLDISDSRVLPRTIADFHEAVVGGLVVADLNVSRIVFNQALAQSLGVFLTQPTVCITRLILEGVEPGQVLGNKGCSILLKALMSNRSLRHINLSLQQFGDANCFDLVEVLARTAIDEVVLKHNNVGDAGARMLRNALAKLEERGVNKTVKVDLDYNMISQELSRYLEETLQRAQSYVIYAFNQQ